MYLCGGFLCCLINVNVHLITGNKIGVGIEHIVNSQF